MNRGIYTGAKGMMTTTQWMDVVSNNLANASTDGYKADTVAFTDILIRNMNQDGGEGAFIGTLGGGPDTIIESTDFTVGPIRSTGNPLDVALQNPRHLFSVRANGVQQFTRDGAFKIDESKTLVTNKGFEVLDDRGNPIRFGKEGKIEISANGSVLQGGVEIAKLGVFQGEFTKSGRNLWSGDRPTLVQEPKLATTSIEGSNVEPIASMIDLIKINRFFEMSQRSIQTQDDMTGKLVDALNRR
jgi:flagellar basal-body rod protein FlgF